jgi:hypothetical protein
MSSLKLSHLLRIAPSPAALGAPRRRSGHDALSFPPKRMVYILTNFFILTLLFLGTKISKAVVFVF